MGMPVPVQETAQASSWLMEFIKANWEWIAPIVSALILGGLDILFNKLPGDYQGKLKKAYDLIRKKLDKK